MTTFSRSNLQKRRRQNIDSEQQHLADEARVPWQQREPHLPDSRYRHVPPRDIEKHILFMRTDPAMRLGKETNLNHLLAGGATASVAGIEMESAWVCKTIEACYVQSHAIGWISFTWVPDLASPGRKRIVMIDPMQFDVFIRINPIGEPDCVYVTRGDVKSTVGLLGLGMGVQSHEQVLGGQVVPNVWTIWTDVPTHYGKLTSTAATVLPAHEEFVLAQHRAIVAEDARACPPLVTEHKEQKQFSLPEKLSADEKTLLLKRHMTSTVGSFQQWDKLQDYLANKERSLGTPAYENIVAAMRDMHNERAETMGRPVVNLEDDRTLVTSQLPEVPADMHERAIMLQQLKLNSQNVPPALIQAESSRSSRIGVDQSALGIFQQNQLHLRSHYTEVIEFMIGTVFAAESVAQMLSGVPLSAQLPSVEEVKKAVKPTVTIPGQPPPDVMRQLYMDGVLKYSALRKHVSSLYSIPLSDLNAEPEISLEDLLTGGKLKVESAKGKMAKDSNESKERQLGHQTKLQEVRNKGTELKAKSATAKPKTSSGGPGKSAKKSSTAR